MISLAIFVFVVFILPTIIILIDTYTDPLFQKRNKDREEAFKRYGQYPPEVYVDFWGNKSIDGEELIKWLILTGQFKENMLASENIKFEWSEDNKDNENGKTD